MGSFGLFFFIAVLLFRMDLRVEIPQLLCINYSPTFLPPSSMYPGIIINNFNFNHANEHSFYIGQYNKNKSYNLKKTL